MQNIHSHYPEVEPDEFDLYMLAQMAARQSARYYTFAEVCERLGLDEHEIYRRARKTKEDQHEHITQH